MQRCDHGITKPYGYEMGGGGECGNLTSCKTCNNQIIKFCVILNFVR